MVLGVTVNYVAVFAAAIAAFVLGFLWYGPLFGKKWMSLQGLTMKDMQKGKEKGMAQTYVMGFIGQLISAFVLAHVISFAAATTVTTGATIGALMWLGFIATTSLGSVLWENKPWGLYILNNEYLLISMALMGAVLVYL